MKKKQAKARTAKKGTAAKRATASATRTRATTRRKDAAPTAGKKQRVSARAVATAAVAAASASRRVLEPLSELKTFLQKRAGENISAPKLEQIVEQSKFFLGTQTVTMPLVEEQPYEIPSGYGDTRIVVQVRDPYWVHAYWEVNQRTHSMLRSEYGESLNASRWLLRVYDITGVSFNGSNANRFFDIELNDLSNSWYINVGVPGRTYCVDIGIRLPDGRFVTIARSNVILTPIDGPSPFTDEEWMIVEDDFNRLYGMSIGLGVGLSSGELRRRIKERMESQVSSGAIFSGSSPTSVPRQRERGFWLVVNTELIVYGATDPKAALSVQGKPIELREDGTFSLRFALPNGEQVIPVRAVSPDKEEERVITPIVTKRTE